VSTESSAPEVSFILGHRGLERLPLLLKTIATICSQDAVRVECLVVEQSVEPEVVAELPEWVRHSHTAVSCPPPPYSRSKAFNDGAREARGHVLVFHDGDMAVPRQYAQVALELVRQGFEVIDLKRFIFYLSEAHTGAILAGRSSWTEVPPMSIVQNAHGGSLVITRSAFEELGGYDEEFIGWGGEDVEFWERAQTRKVWNFGIMPLIHLWHAPQPGKTPAKRTPGMERWERIGNLDPNDRILALRKRNRFDQSS
jgi:hypothetical protein